MKFSFLRLLLPALLLLSAAACSRTQQTYRAGLAAQRKAERLLAAGDTTAALRSFRDAYVAFVDCDQKAHMQEALVRIQVCKKVEGKHYTSEEGWQMLLENSQQALAGQRMREQRVRTLLNRTALGAGILIALLVVVLLIHRHRARKDLLRTRDELLESQQALTALRNRSASPALTLALHHYDQLCSRYEADGDNSALLREFQQQIADMQHDTAFEQELEAAIAENDPELPGLIRTQPDLSDDEQRLLRYLAAGLPTHLIAAAMGKSRQAVNMQTSRLRSRIETADPAHAARLFACYDARRPGRPQRK